MCQPEVPSVWLHVGGRSFYCPFCKHSRLYPPPDPTFFMVTHAFCETCATFMRIEGVSAPLERPASRGAAVESEGRGALR